MTVSQKDREAAAKLVEWFIEVESKWGHETFFSSQFPEGIRLGYWDNHPIVEAFARHAVSIN